MAFLQTTAASISSGGTINGDLTISGDLTVEGGGGFSYSEVLTGDMKITNANATIGLEIQQTGDGSALKINQDVNDQTSIYIDSESQTANVIHFLAPATTTAYGIMLDDMDSLTTGGGMQIKSNSSSTGTRSLLKIVNDNASATGATGLYIQQDSTGPALVAIGNVGIGTATISNYDNIGTGNTAQQLVIQSASGGDPSAIQIAKYSGSDNMGGEAIGKLSFLAFPATTAVATAEIVASTPSGDGDASEGVLDFYTSTGNTSTKRMTIDSSGNMKGGNAGGWYLYNGAPSGTVPAYAFADDTNTGMGQDGADNLHLISGGATKLLLDANSRISLSNNDTGAQNTIFGYRAFNTADGGEAGNVVIGYDCGLSINNAGSDNNTIIGNEAGIGGTNILIGAVVIGSGAMISTGSGGDTYTGTVAIGRSALAALTSGARNTAVGYQALQHTDTGTDNIAIGYQALSDQDVGGSGNAADSDHNIAIGSLAMSGAWTDAKSESNIAIGTSSMAGDMAAGLKNIAIGTEALNDLVSGNHNVAIGYRALDELTNSSENIAIGAHALNACDAGEGGNIALGYNAGGDIDHANSDNNVIIGTSAGIGGDTAAMKECIVIGTSAMTSTSTNAQTGTIAIGHQSLNALTTGAGNTAVGYQSLDAQVTGDNNTAIGYSALGANAVADGAGNNTAIGFDAAKLLATGVDNVVIGSAALDAADGTESYNVAIGSGAMGAVDEGGGAANFNVCIGRNAGLGGVSTEFNSNIAIGYGAFDGSSSQLISNVVAIGHEALSGAVEDEAAGTVAVGYNALTALTSGAGNVAVGYQAGLAIADDSYNTVIGYQAGSVTTGEGNTYVGHFAGKGTSGADGNNVGVGKDALTAITIGVENVCIGKDAGDSITTANQTVLIGTDAGQAITVTGTSNVHDGTVAIGLNALKILTTGAGNVAMGAHAGNILTTGGTNTIIGYDADVDANSRAGCVIIGSSLSLNTASDNVVEIGNDTNSMTYDLDGGDITVTSDVRTKKDIKDSMLGLEFINRLRPITYKTKPSSQYPKEFGIKEPSKKSSNKVWDGLIAQEVKEVMDEMDVGFSGWEEGINTKQRLAYGKFVMPLIKAVQELTARVKELEDA